MTEENLGSGIYLDELFDFEVDQTGDVLSTDGIDELEKDLAVQMKFNLRQFLGEVPSSQLNAEVRRTVAQIAIADNRIVSVDRNNIDVEWKERTKKLVVSMSIVTNTNEKYNLVFNV